MIEFCESCGWWFCFDFCYCLTAHKRLICVFSMAFLAWIGRISICRSQSANMIREATILYLTGLDKMTFDINSRVRKHSVENISKTFPKPNYSHIFGSMQVIDSFD